MKNWRGKAIGGSIGSFFGPLGALAGAAAGHYFVDRKTNKPENEPLRLMAITAAALYELANINKPYTKKKDNVIRSVLSEMNQHLGTQISPHELAYLIDKAYCIDRGLVRLTVIARTLPDLAHIALVWLWRVAVSDGTPLPATVDGIFSFARQTGQPESEARNTARFYVRSSINVSDQTHRNACTVLQIPYHANVAVAKRAYRHLSLKYHPDKNRHLDPDIYVLTVEKFTQIKNAYDLLAGQETPNNNWVSKDAETGRILMATSLTSVRCLICDKPAKLPALELLAFARCVHCQTLLAMERELVEQLGRKD